MEGELVILGRIVATAFAVYIATRWDLWPGPPQP